MNTSEKVEGFAKLREHFPQSAIGKIPRGGKGEKSRCSVCQGWHAAGATHLDYVGHAQVTARLLDVDVEWTWEPLATNEFGLPVFDHAQSGQPVGLWIKLTVLGHTRLGYGTVEPGAFDPVKQLIGDAIRNAAMRFGVALDLWSKEELVSDSAGSAPSSASQSAPPAEPKAKASRSNPNHSGGEADGPGHTPKQAAESPASPSEQVSEGPVVGEVAGSSENQTQQPGGASQQAAAGSDPTGGENGVPPAAESWTAIHAAVGRGDVKQVKVQITAAHLCTARDGVPIPANYEDVQNCPPDVLAEIVNRLGIAVAA